jgi:hypothetical protein
LPALSRKARRGRSARFIRGCLLRSLKAISYFQAITRAHDARAFFNATSSRIARSVRPCLGGMTAIATRYDKLARNFLAAVQLISAMVLLNSRQALVRAASGSSQVAGFPHSVSSPLRTGNPC